MLYSVARFTVEFFRVHEQGNVLGGAFDTSQYISAGLFLAGLACFWQARRHPAPALA
jgi:prolipoprotein diacylglyceryltransferase